MAETTQLELVTPARIMAPKSGANGRGTGR